MSIRGLFYKRKHRFLVVLLSLLVFTALGSASVAADEQPLVPPQTVKADGAGSDAATSRVAPTEGKPAGRISDPLKAAIYSKERTATYATRDKARHPYETLAFFKLAPDLTVVELTPGAGWYTEILAPYLREKGRYIAAGYDPKSENAEYRHQARLFQKKIEAKPELYDKVETVVFEPPHALAIAAPESVDRVLTFRNLHNWVAQGDGTVEAVLASLYKVLKPGGILGVVDHRLPADKPFSEMADSGYLPEAFVIELIQKAGFRLDEQSEINANPKDTANHPHGVWALPPTYRNQDMGRKRYEAIGESDRMTLRFIKEGSKPEH